VFIFFKELNLNCLYYFIYQTIAWAVIAFLINFYAVYRFTTPVEITSKIVKQGILFLLVIIAFFPFSKEVLFSGKAIAYFMVSSFTLITIFKYLLFYYLKKYRVVTGSNYRSAVIIGYTPESIRLKVSF
jgi:putative colanic acid biosynthesis UDP-glucose lipid carrier transferase